MMDDRYVPFVMKVKRMFKQLLVLVLVLQSTICMAVETADISKELIGNIPIAEPQYDGVDHLLVLSNQWVIVATKNVQQVIDEINRLSNNELTNMVKLWDESEKAGKPNWTAYRGRWNVRDKYIAQARQNLGEFEMDNTSYYAIQSNDDSNYRSPSAPSRMTRLLIPLGGQEVVGSHDMDYAHYSYLELPKPMQSGKNYTISLKNGKKVTFLFDEKATLARSIKVNQVGYMASMGHKYAYLGCHLFEFGAMDCSYAKRFDLIDAKTGKVIYSGKPTLRGERLHFTDGAGKSDPKKPLISGENVYELDFSSVTAPGIYFISIPEVGRSWPFRIDDGIYGEIFFMNMRGLFHQRASFELTSDYTAWTRKRYHTKPIYESEAISGPRQGGGFTQANRIDQNQFDIIGGSIDRSRKTTTVEGGWYDAADWDRNEAHYVLIFDMLTAYEQNPKKFTDGQLHFNESGNGIPDILDEVEWGLRIWRYSQDDRGGISGKVETWTHPKIDADVDYAFSQRTRWNSLMYAAAAAQYAQMVEPFDSQLSSLYKNSAIRAYQFGMNQSNALRDVTVHGKTKRGQGEPFEVKWTESDELNFPYIVHAKLRMYYLTKEKQYLDGLEEFAGRAQKPFSWRFTHKDWSAWIYYSIVNGPASKLLSSKFVKQWEDVYLKAGPVGTGRNHALFVGQNLIDMSNMMPYRFSMPMSAEQFGWGDTITTNYNRAAFIAYTLTNDINYIDVMIQNANFTLGANPMGMSWTTGLGFTYPAQLQHAFSTDDGIDDPVPGITIYGVTSGPRFHYFRNNVWQSPNPEDKPISFMKKVNQSIPAYRRWGCHPMLNTAKCEFTVHETMSSAIFTAAFLMPEGWMPDERLKNLKPRKKNQIYGYWYLP